MSTVLSDSKHLERFRIFRYEDFLVEPEKRTRELCDFLGLDFEIGTLPAPGQKVPFATKYSQRWYPLRPEVIQPYYDAQSEEHFDAVEQSCGDLASAFGYQRPRK